MPKRLLLEHLGVSRWKALLWGDRPVFFALGLVLGATIAFAVLSMGGCAAHSSVEPARNSADRTVTTTKPDGSVITERVTLSSEGPSGEASGDNARTEADGKAGALTLPGNDKPGGVGPSGGDTSVISSIDTSKAVRAALAVFGALVLVGGVWLGYSGSLGGGLVLGGSGLGIIAIAVFPAILIFVVAGIALLALGYSAYAGYLGPKLKGTLTNVVRGVKAAGDAAEPVKDSIGTFTTEAQDKLIATIKAGV